MKLKQQFVLREIAGDSILIPVGNINDSFQGIMTLNETSVFIWKQLEQEKDKEEILEAILEEYEVSREQAERNLEDFLKALKKIGIL